MHSLSLGASALVIPFGARSAQAVAIRRATQPLWVDASDAESHCGYGEDCPRVCETGDSLVNGGHLEDNEIFARTRRCGVRPGEAPVIRVARLPERCPNPPRHRRPVMPDRIRRASP